MLPSATLAGAAPKLSTDLGGQQQLEVPPPVISFTGDGSGFFGGFTGRSSVRQPSRLHFGWAGRIRWSLWSRTQADGRGAVWLNNGIPDDARGTFHAYPVTLRAFRPRHGVFTRLAYRFIFAGHTYTRTLHAHYVPASEFVPGRWAWPGG